MLADAKPLPLKLSPPNYLPNWNTISAKVLEKTKLIYLTYPNNPTGSTATQDDFDEAIHRFKGTQTKIVHDFAYSAFGFDAKNPSILASKMQKMLLSRYSLYLKVIICQAFVLGLLLVIKNDSSVKEVSNSYKCRYVWSTSRCCYVCTQSL